MRCKHFAQNQKEGKCKDYYWSHASATGTVVKCRLKEWCKKRGICPYDDNIFSLPKTVKKDIKDRKQILLSQFN